MSLYSPTRAQLARFIPDHETIKSFEYLFDAIAALQTSLALFGLPLRTQVETPNASGFNVTIVPTVSTVKYNVWLLLKPAAAYAAGTITLPAVADCEDMQYVTVSCTQAVTTLTVAGNGATVTGAPATLAANATFSLRYNLATTTWHRVE